MKRAICCLLAVLISVSAAFAQESAEVDPQVTSGFRLGKFYVSSLLLASDLNDIISLCAEQEIALITEENYQAELIDDEDIRDASLVLAYAMYRAQFMILPLCERGLAEDAFDELAQPELSGPMQEILAELQQLTLDFVNNADFQNLGGYCEQVAAAGYIDMLVALSEQAQGLAGDMD